MEIDDILKNFGEPSEEPKDPEGEISQRWHDLIKPTTVNIILGRKGTGKSALGYYLLETVGREHSLLPIVVNLPKAKQELLPNSFRIKSLEEVKRAPNSIVLIDEGTTTLPAGQAKLEEMIKGFQALSRQRNQIIIFIFHASSDVGSRILRGVDTILLKEPSKRQIQHGSKDNWWHDLLLEAKGKFKTVADMGEDKRKYTYVDCEEPELRILLVNPLCSFWTEELSCAWAGTEIEKGVNLFGMGHSPTPQRRKWVAVGEAAPPAEFSIEPITEAGIIVGFTIYDPTGSTIRHRGDIVELIHKQFPGVSKEEVESARIGYEDYIAHIRLPER